jgi:hypothetical protein
MARMIGGIPPLSAISALSAVKNHADAILAAAMAALHAIDSSDNAIAPPRGQPPANSVPFGGHSVLTCFRRSGGWREMATGLRSGASLGGTS